MMDFEAFLQLPMWDVVYAGNTLGMYAFSLGVFSALFIILGIFKSVVLRKLRLVAQKSKTDIDDIAIAIISQIHPPFYSFVAFVVALQFINVADMAEKAIMVILFLWVTYQVIAMMRVFIDRVVSRKFGQGDGSAQAATQLLSAILTFVIWILSFLLILQNLGVNVTSLIAGLGIGGLAVALALQSVLSDLFSSFSILFDKPFTVGDFIIAGSVVGTVEKIGIKTTRLRAPSGEQIVMSNTELTSAVIQNYKLMDERRSIFEFGVVYETEPSMLDRIPLLVEDAVKAQEKTRFMHAHFKEFGDSAYVYEVIYYVESSDYYEFLSVHDAVCRAIVRVCEKEKIEMAYPTHRVYMSQVKE